MRGRLLAATLTCLVETGSAGTTTATIESRAGVSRGARLHHFPTKAALLAATVEAFYAELAQRYADALRTMGPDGQNFSAGFALLWKTYRDPANAALFEILIQARTDPDLRSALQELASRRAGETRRSANALFPDLATPEADGLLECLQAAMLGLALREAVFGESRSETRARELLEAMVSERFFGRAANAKETTPHA